MRLRFVLLMLALVSLACYSDSPLWPNELTPAPPTVTPLPPPPAGASRFQVGDIAWLPKTVSELGIRADLTTYPEPVNVNNRVPCTQDTPLRILYTGINLDDGTIYQLVDCNRLVGWVREEGILGPITIQVNERALTLESGASFGSFKVEAADPPYDSDNNFRPQYDCKINDIVDVIAITGFSTGELYYKIRCANPFNPVAPNVGWTTPDKLFGPVRFRNGEAGLVPTDAGQIELTLEAGGSETGAVCPAGERVLMTETPVQRIQNELFYEIQCGENTGWVNQNLLVGPLIYAPGDLILVIAPVQSLAEQTAETAATEEVPQEANLTVSLISEPSPLTTKNEAGTCLDGTLTRIDEIVGVGGGLYIRVRCGEVEGWLPREFIYGPAEYAIGDTVLLGEQAVIGFNQRGIYLSREIKDIEGPSGGTSVISGECDYDVLSAEPVPAEILDVGYLRNSFLQVSGIFYRISCLGKENTVIEGWIKQDRLGVE